MNGVLLIAGFIELATAIPYIRDVRKGITKPSIVSWFTWMMLSLLAACASFSEGAVSSFVVAIALTLECALIVFISLEKGVFTYTAFDGFCQIAAILGALLWWWTNEPIVALLLFVVVDLIGALPTFRHAWRRPKEETISTFTLSIFGNALALSAAPVFAFPEILVPAYLLSINTLLSTEIFFRRRFTQGR